MTSSKTNNLQPDHYKAIKPNLLFHFYRNHKFEIVVFRIWFIARNIVDAKGRGLVNIDTLCGKSGLGKKYIKRLCRKSNLFTGMTDSLIYYMSMNKVMRKHKLYLSKGKIRIEKITKQFEKQFKNKKAFEGYICKCYMENDLDKKNYYKTTKGRIGYDRMAEYFRISRLTAITNIKISAARRIRNMRHYPEYRFKNKREFHNWILNNLNIRIAGHKIENNLRSYRIRKIKNNEYHLIQQLPNFYKFTGARLVNIRTHRGKSGK